MTRKRTARPVPLRDMTREERDLYDAAYGAPHEVEFWGATYTVTPAVVHTVFGDGRKAFCWEPANTRPNYYVVLGDSRWSDSNFDRNCIAEHEEDIYQAIEEEYGNSGDDYEAWDADRDEDDDSQGPDPLPWPALSEDSGVAWGKMRVQPWQIRRRARTAARRAATR